MIGFAKIENGWLKIYDNAGKEIASVSVGLDARLLNYTCKTVAVKDGDYAYLHDADSKKIPNGIHL